MAGLNLRRRQRGDEVLACGIALHVGEVMYGNIGASDRLDFTVIGPAVNLAVRIEGLCRILERDLLISADFARGCELGPVRSLGRHRLRGIRRAVEIFTLPEAA
jgi:adenylate cyclase